MGIGERLASKFRNCHTDDNIESNMKVNKDKYDLVKTMTGEVKFRISKFSNYKSSGLKDQNTVLMTGTMSMNLPTFIT